MPSGTAVAEEIDLAVAAYRDGGEWRAEDIPLAALESLDDVARHLRRMPGDSAVALLSVDEDFFILLRPTAADYRVLLSDATAATEFEIARSVVDHLRIPVEDDAETEPAGDLALLTDLGMSAVELGLVVDDDDLYPDEQLSDIATRLGFGEAFDDLAGLTTA
ncbi:hypothetical protein D9V37_17900 [Nocardioides mangrovicus]|uniref:tRNA adenosine deaminase n=1 Tax=Nocardioides mangrovicus TaxID=2478913 RepID=A0A3L8NXN1_9ACTN|nr:tRNA adenosine deaminase-associated protein [Nocardioides mangrovicus]RLV47976.1 hypothetical protein D9V37_17900 [Nocardioides mangrovicus]